MSLFAKGFSKVRDEQKRQEKEAKARKGQLFNFFLTSSQPDGVLVFLHNEPIVFPAHQVQEGQRWITKVCVADEGDCEYCARGDNMSTKGGYIVIDRTPFEYTDQKSGKKKVNEGQLKLYLPGIRVLGQLDRKNTLKGLTGKEWYVSRTGSSTSTVYDFESGEDIQISAAMIRDLLAEELKQFAPKNDNPAEIERAMLVLLQDQLKKLLPDTASENVEDDDNEEVQERPKPVRLLGRRNKQDD